jgi:hypothetical protein
MAPEEIAEGLSEAVGRRLCHLVEQRTALPWGHAPGAYTTLRRAGLVEMLQVHTGRNFAKATDLGRAVAEVLERRSNLKGQ